MILVTAPVHPDLLAAFDAKGLAYDYSPKTDRTELMSKIGIATGLVITTKLKIDKEVIDAAPNLKWIGRLGSGMELIDTVYAAEKGILCVSSPEGNSNAVAEHALGLLLNILRRITIASNEVRENIWLREQNRGSELSGKTVGIIGFGNTGRGFAKLLSAFDVQVLAFDKYKKGFGGGNVREAGLPKIMENADVISFHVPLTSETKYMANAEFFSGLSKKPVIINTSRGPVVEQSAIAAAVRNKAISGAALDVLENEDLSSYSHVERDALKELQSHENILLTPHIAGYTHEAFRKMAMVLLNKLPL